VNPLVDKDLPANLPADDVDEVADPARRALRKRVHSSTSLPALPSMRCSLACVWIEVLVADPARFR